MDPSAQHALRMLTSRREALARHARPGACPSDALAMQFVEVDEATLRELREIDAAIERILSGTWGTCEKCGGAVGRDRLRALPEVRFCSNCSP